MFNGEFNTANINGINWLGAPTIWEGLSASLISSDGAFFVDSQGATPVNSGATLIDPRGAAQINLDTSYLSVSASAASLIG